MFETDPPRQWEDLLFISESDYLTTPPEGNAEHIYSNPRQQLPNF